MTEKIESNSPTAAQRLATLQQILDRIQKQQMEMQKVLDAFYALPYRDHDAYLALNTKVIETLDTVLRAEDWQDSFFLRSTLKPLQQLRERVGNLQEKLVEEAKEKERGTVLKDTQIPVFLSLYQAQGDQLAQWEILLRSLSRHVQGRAVYADRELVEQLIRSRPSSVPEAYAVIAVEKTDIVSEAQPRKDRIGLPVLTLKEGAIHSENIIEFVHMGKHYQWQPKELALKSKNVES